MITNDYKCTHIAIVWNGTNWTCSRTIRFMSMWHFYTLLLSLLVLLVGLRHHVGVHGVDNFIDGALRQLLAAPIVAAQAAGCWNRLQRWGRSCAVKKGQDWDRLTHFLARGITWHHVTSTWHHVACASWKSKGIRDVPNGANWEKSKLEEVPMRNWLWESV